MNRMTSPKKWQDSWFLSLPPNLKLLWIWCTDNCDLAGVLPDANWHEVGKLVGVNAPKTALKAFAGRLVTHYTGKLVIVGFAKFQNSGKTLAERSNAQIQYLLEQHGMTEDDVLPKAVLPTEADLDCLAGEDEAVIEKAGELKAKICTWFNRRKTTRWTSKEMRALKDVVALQTDPADLASLEQYYMAKMAADQDYRRRDVVTLLNNWNGEIDRARAFCSTTKKPVTQQQIRL
jgi:hypothetical protein